MCGAAFCPIVMYWAGIWRAGIHDLFHAGVHGAWCLGVHMSVQAAVPRGFSVQWEGQSRKKKNTLVKDV
jgi:hypothetical protein